MDYKIMRTAAYKTLGQFLGIKDENEQVYTGAAAAHAIFKPVFTTEKGMQFARSFVSTWGWKD